MRELTFEAEICRVCREHLVCDSQSEEIVEELTEEGTNEFCGRDFDRCPCCGCLVSDETKEDREYELRAIQYLREEE